MVRLEEPQMNADERRLNPLTESIIGCAYTDANELGCGFLEKPYENALAHELRLQNIPFEQQVPIVMRYKGIVVGEYIADMVVAGKVLVELKAVQALDAIHEAQCINYPKATGYKICLLINFGKSKIAIRRIVHNL